jgi:hypothetical protein
MMEVETVSEMLVILTLLINCDKLYLIAIKTAAVNDFHSFMMKTSIWHTSDKYELNSLVTKTV